MNADFDTDEPRFTALYIGVVIDREDPESLGRVRIRIPGLVEPATGWAFPLGTTGGGSDSRGFFDVPEKGADVGVLFHHGDVDHPYYLCGHWGKPGGTAEVPTPVKGLSKTDAPKVKAYETNRFLLVFDERSGSENLLIKDKTSGDLIKFDSSGLTVHGANKVKVEASSVEIAGGGPAAARKDDPVVPSSAMTSWMSQVAGACNGIAPGSVAPPTPVGAIGQIQSGSSKVTIG
jgi:uncharacterized protein involved in type VI secretion and phage assembly